MNELALFAGAGGGILGGQLLGWHTVCAVEWEPYAACVLAQRQNDGLLPAFPIWDDVQTFDGRPWRGVVDVVSGGFPCQDISAAGKGAGIGGSRSGLWAHMARIIGEVRPGFCFVENSPLLRTRGLEIVIGDLAALGYDCRWTVLGAAEVGAPHRRDRFWLVATLADSDGGRQSRQQRQAGAWQAGAACGCCQGVADADRVRELQPGRRKCQEPGRACDCGAEVRDANGARLEERQGEPGHARQELAAIERTDWWQLEPDVGRVADGVAARVDRLKALGNGQVPRCAAQAWRMLTQSG